MRFAPAAYSICIRLLVAVLCLRHRIEHLDHRLLIQLKAVAQILHCRGIGCYLTYSHIESRFVYGDDFPQCRYSLHCH